MHPSALTRARASHLRKSNNRVNFVHFATVSRPLSTRIPASCSPLAFAFDIDGVLLRGPHVIPAAKRALSLLDRNNPSKWKIPFILLTNGGGVSEAERSHKLSKQLGVKIEPSQYLQGHSILKTLVHRLADVPVLALGGRNNGIRSVIEGYGFREVYTPIDVLAWNPSIWPFHDLTPVELSTAKKADFSQIRIGAIFVVHDPRDWGLDIQVMSDVMRSGGVIGSPANDGAHHVELVFCNPDLLWGNDFVVPRFGQGAFRMSFQAVYKSLTGSSYLYTQYGKPTLETYRFAEHTLMDQVEETQGHRYQPHVYMIGDNPESDIAGANAINWTSILVHTGVYDPQHGPPRYQPVHESRDVEEAVRWAIDKELGRY